MSNDAEITLEANPADLDEAGYSALLTHGINRLSLGIQSFDDRVLKEMFRSHTGDEAIASFSRARSAGFKNVSIDLILGWPDETRERFLTSLHRAIGLQPDHLSLYILETDGKTVVAYREKVGTLNLPDEDLVADLFLESEEILSGAGLLPYEISSYALAGFESRHNGKYWDDTEFLAFGMAAHGYRHGRRYWNESTFATYCTAMETRGSALAGSRTLSRKDQLQEAVMTGLRRRSGIERDRFTARYGIDLLAAFPRALGGALNLDLVRVDPHHVALTKKGVLLSNEVFRAILDEVPPESA